MQGYGPQNQPSTLFLKDKSIGPYPSVSCLTGELALRLESPFTLRVSVMKSKSTFN